MSTNELTMEAEQALAGAVLIDGRTLDLLPETLRDTDFYSQTCGAVFAAVKEIHNRGAVINSVSLKEWGKQNNFVFDENALMELMELTPGCKPAAEYARIVHESALRRALQKAAREIAQDDKSPLTGFQNKVEIMNNIMSHVGSDVSSTFDTVEYEPPRWLIEPYFPRGKGTLIQADPGTGKTALICAIAAAVSAGRSILGLRVQAPGDVVLISNEDDLGVLRGRLEANGAHLHRIHFLRNAHSLTFQSPEIEQCIRKYHARLVVFDPMQSFMGENVDLHRANETRPILASLFNMCQKQDCACVIIAHLGKSNLGKSLVNQSLGSVDIPAAMRSILHITKNPELEGELLAFHIKSSNAPKGKAIAYSIVDKGGVRFNGFSDLLPEDLERIQKEKGKNFNEYDHEPLVQVFNQMLTDKPEGGFWSYDGVREACNAILGGFSYNSSSDLRTRLEAPGFQKELLEKDHIFLRVGVKSHGIRGIRLERYKVPDSYQAKLPGDVLDVGDVLDGGFHRGQATPAIPAAASANHPGRIG